MTLADQLNKDLLASLKAGDTLRRGVLSLVKSGLTNYKIEQKKDKLSDEDVLKVLARELKSRKEAAKVFRDGGANERAEQEEAEAKILTEYLPKQMSRAELVTKVDAVIEKVGARTIKDTGKVMSVLASELKGAADMGEVSNMVKEKLNGK